MQSYKDVGFLTNLQNKLVKLGRNQKLINKVNVKFIVKYTYMMGQHPILYQVLVFHEKFDKEYLQTSRHKQNFCKLILNYIRFILFCFSKWISSLYITIFSWGFIIFLNICFLNCAFNVGIDFLCRNTAERFLRQ